MAAQAASGANNLIHGNTQAMGNNLAATGAAIKQTAVQDYNQAGAGAQRLASGNVSAADLEDATGRGLMTGIIVMSPMKSVGAVGTETKVVTSEARIADAVDANTAKGAAVPEQSAAATTDQSASAATTATPDLKRPYIRKDVRAEVEARAPKTADGKFIDPNTGEVIEGKYDLGHKAGNEFRTEKSKAQAQGLTQKQFNPIRVNSPPLAAFFS